MDLKGQIASLTLYLPNVRKVDLKELKTYIQEQPLNVIGISCLGGVTAIMLGSLASYLKRKPRSKHRFPREKYRRQMLGPCDTKQDPFDRKLTITSFSDLTALVGPASSGTTLSDYQKELTREIRVYSPEENFPLLEGNRTFMALYLTKELYKELYPRKTYTGLTIDDVIQIGVDVPNHNFCGISAGDEEVYDVFSPLVDHVIGARHQGFRRVEGSHTHSMNPLEITGPELNKDYVNNIHFVVARSIKGYRFAPSCSRAERRDLEERLRRALQTLTGEFNGTYKTIGSITRETYNLMSDVFKNMADEPCADWLVKGGYARDWPDGRGIYYTNNNSLVVSVNKEDHLRVFFKNNSSDFAASFEKFVELMDQLEFGIRGQGLEFAHHDDLGYLSACPSTTGTGLRLGVNLRLTKLCQYPRGALKAILNSLSLKSVGRAYDPNESHCLDVYNQQRLGISEVAIANTVKEGARFLIALERRLQRGMDVQDLLTAIGISQEQTESH